MNYRSPQKLFREDVDLASVDPYDWSKFPEIIYPLNPLRPELKKDFIYNWDKLVSLFNDPFQMSPVVKSLIDQYQFRQ